MSEYRDITVGVGLDINNNVELTIWTDIVQGEATRVTLSPDRAAALLRDLANQTTYALTAAATTIARGDCATCKNARMVKVPTTSGRESNEHCLDCALIGARNGFPLRPQVGGGLA